MGTKLKPSPDPCLGLCWRRYGTGLLGICAWIVFSRFYVTQMAIFLKTKSHTNVAFVTFIQKTFGVCEEIEWISSEKPPQNSKNVAAKNKPVRCKLPQMQTNARASNETDANADTTRLVQPLCI